MTAQAPEKQGPSPDEIIADLKTQLEERDAELEKLRPTKNIAVRLFRDADEVVDYFGRDKLKEMVEERIASENVRLNRKGFDRIKHDKVTIKDMTDRLVDEFIIARNESQPPPAPDPITRTLKMVKPDGTLIQIPYEGQVNNVAGSLADGLLIYERKGFKRTEPFLCPSQDCWEDAGLVESGRNRGKWAFDGYCSEDHRARTERGAEAVPGSE